MGNAYQAQQNKRFLILGSILVSSVLLWFIPHSVLAATYTVVCNGASSSPTIVTTESTYQSGDIVNFSGTGYCELDQPINVGTTGTINVGTGVTITHFLGDTDGITMTAGTLMIETNAALNANTKGCSGGADSYTDGYGPDAVTGVCTYGATGAGDANNYGGGAGHGGAGGKSSGGITGKAYDTLSAPNLLGSGGGGGSAWQSGGTGGGKIRLDVSGTLTVNGNISSNAGTGGSGIPYGTGYSAGGGSGGSIYITTDTFTGSGTITASGGNGGEDGNSGASGGGGGRIAVYYTQSTYSSLSQITAPKGLKSIGPGCCSSGQDGQAGTTFIIDRSVDDLYVTSGIDFVAGEDYTRRNITFYPNTELRCGTTNSLTIGATGTLNMQGVSWVCDTVDNVTIEADTWLTSNTNTLSFQKRGAKVMWNIAQDLTLNNVTYFGALPAEGIQNSSMLTLRNSIAVQLVNTDIYSNVDWTTLTNLNVDSNSVFNANIKGCAGGLDGALPGYGYGPDLTTGACTYRGSGAGDVSNYGGGAGHGGAGGRSSTNRAGIQYESSLEPNLLGSGGGGGSLWQIGGTGGGKIRLDVSGTLTMNGSITSNASDGTSGLSTGTGYSAGGGSGGSIYITSGTFTGSGTITASGGNGGADGSTGASGGGGGRIAVYYTQSTYSSLSQITAPKGLKSNNNGCCSSGQDGTDGSVYLSVNRAIPFTDPQVIQWNNCQVQHTRSTISSGQNSKTVAITEVDPTKAFVLVDSTGTNSVANSSAHDVSAKLFNDHVLLERISTSGDVQTSIQVVSCPKDEMYVQHGTAQLLPGHYKFIVNLLPYTAAQDASLVIASTRTDVNNTDQRSALVTIALDQYNTDLILQRSDTTANNQSTTAVEYQVVSFSPGSNVTVQTNEVNLGNGAQASNTISEVDLQSSWLYCNWDATHNGLQQSSVGCELSDSRTVVAHRYTSNNYANRVRYYVVEFPSDAVNVIRGAENNNPQGVADNTEYFHQVTIPATTDDVAKEFSFTSTTVSGTDLSYPRERWLQEFVDPLTLKYTFYRTVGDTTDANTKYWQVMQFNKNFSPSHYLEAIGWGWIGNAPGIDAEGDTSYPVVGLISFNCDNLNTYYGTDCGDGTSGTRHDYNVQLDSGGCGIACDIKGRAWIGGWDSNDSAPSPLGIIDFDPDVISGYPATVGDDSSTPEDERLSAHWNEETGEVYGWARFLALEKTEDQLNPANNNDWGWIKLRGPINDGSNKEYGVLFHPDTRLFSGWGWNDDGTIPGTSTRSAGAGIGWVKFDLDLKTSTTEDAFIQTLQGDVYAQQGINMKSLPPISSTGQQLYNATYLIQSNGAITNFISQFATSDPNYAANSTYGALHLPIDNNNNVYRGDIGTIHVNELIAQADVVDDDGDGVCTETLLTNNTHPLSNKIFYCNGDLEINQNVTFHNAVGNSIDNGLGAGTIVVNGDLIIRDNINYYNTTLSTHINNLASVGWVVLGDIRIEPTVNNIVGTFISLEDNGNDGRSFYTGSGNSPLQISGLVAARGFVFQRQDIGTDSEPAPAEKIIYDQRIIANTPPGLEDFAKTLPVIQ